jgi:uncharacterized membrane protein
MVDGLLVALTLVAALGSALIGGVFFAFSSFVMAALARLPHAPGIAAMQSINVAVINPWFLGPFIGTAAASALVAGSAPLRWSEPEAPRQLVGGLLYLVGTFGVTRGSNVPRNDALAAVAADSADGAALWERYIPGWTAWNTVRTVAALAAAAALTVALIVGVPGQAGEVLRPR